MIDPDTSSIAIRGLGPDRAEDLRRIRLEALRSSSVFMPLIDGDGRETPLEIEMSWPIAVWRGLLARPDDRAFFGGYDGARIVGLSQLLRIGPDCAELKSAFVLPDYRGRGIWRRMTEARITHALACGIRRLRIGHRLGNEPMQRLLRTSPFRLIGHEAMTNPYQDGVCDTRALYEAILDDGMGPP